MDDQNANRESGSSLISNPRFAVSVGMLLLGVMCFACLFLLRGGPNEAIAFGLFVAGGALIGGAILHLFRLWIWGLVVGGFIMIALLLFLLSQPHIVG